MKNLKNLTEKYTTCDEKGVVCEYVMAPYSNSCVLTTPILSTGYTCRYCNQTAHHAPLLDPSISNKRVWICANAFCDVNKTISLKSNGNTPTPISYGLEWPLFCEYNGIGDLFYTLKFEDMNQDKKRIEFFFKFACHPAGVIFMQGTTGSGKTFAAMAICELFIRRSTSCIFITHRNLKKEYEYSYKTRDCSTTLDRLPTIDLLVIDDFGTGETSPSFMEFFMGVLDTRNQYSNKGTIITTNLDNQGLSDKFGDALNDRIRTGQKFIFKEKSRRKPFHQ